MRGNVRVAVQENRETQSHARETLHLRVVGEKRSVSLEGTSVGSVVCVFRGSLRATARTAYAFMCVAPREMSARLLPVGAGEGT